MHIIELGCELFHLGCKFVKGLIPRGALNECILLLQNGDNGNVNYQSELENHIMVGGIGMAFQQGVLTMSETKYENC